MFTYKLEIQWIDSTLSHWMSCSGLLDSKYQVPTVLYCIIEMLLSEMRDTWQPDNLTTDNIDFLIVTLSSRQSTHFILHRLLISVWSLHNCNKLHNVRFSNLDDAGGEAWSVTCRVLPPPWRRWRWEGEGPDPAPAPCRQISSCHSVITAGSIWRCDATI